MNTDWRPDASLAMGRKRALLLRTIRDFFERREVLEVETPTMSVAGNTDPAIDSFRAGTRYLRTSPEFPMKRLLAAGWGSIYELGRVFRAEEAGRWHNPEFTMLEWYRIGFDDRVLAAEVVDLIGACFEALGRARCDAQFIAFEDVIESLGVGLVAEFSLDAFARLANSRGWPQAADRKEALEMLLALAFPDFARNVPLLVVTDFPAELAALAQIRDDEIGLRRTSGRFEVYLNGLELANGYHELTDPKELDDRFETENQRRSGAGKPSVPVDHRLIDAQHAGLPDCAGVALGVDRLLASIVGASSLREVMAFSSIKA